MTPLSHLATFGRRQDGRAAASARATASNFPTGARRPGEKPARKAKKKTVAKKSRKLTLKKKVQTDLTAGDKTAKSVKAGYVFRAAYDLKPAAITNVSALNKAPLLNRPSF